MSHYQCNVGQFACRAGTFRPTGKLQRVGRRYKNPVVDSFDADNLSARLFVGFNVGGKPRWTMSDLVRVAAAVRNKQTGDPSASFLAQTGIYKHHGGDVVKEKSAQLVIIDTAGTPKTTFTRQMVSLAEQIARKLKQETVIVEVQKAGIAQRVYVVGP